MNTLLVNATLSIDLSISWNPEDVDIKEISVGDKPVRSNEAYFADPSSRSLYSWGGFRFRPEEPAGTDLWRFQVDERGNGRWERETSANEDVFGNLLATGSAACVTTPDDAYLFGGNEWNNSKQGVKGFYKYNFETTEWSQQTEVGYATDHGFLWGGTATYVSGFGSKGLIFILGGITGRYTADRTHMPFNTVHFYDIGTGRWHSQETSGDQKPNSRRHHCAVGAGGFGDSNTYEM